jgi:hypothetical protein
MRDVLTLSARLGPHAGPLVSGPLQVHVASPGLALAIPKSCRLTRPFHESPGVRSFPTKLLGALPRKVLHSVSRKAVGVLPTKVAGALATKTRPLLPYFPCLPGLRMSSQLLPVDPRFVPLRFSRACIPRRAVAAPDRVPGPYLIISFAASPPAPEERRINGSETS